MYLCANFEVASIIIISFRQGGEGNFPPATSKRTPKKPTQIRVKTLLLFNLIGQQPDTDKIYLQAKDVYKTKYRFLINKRESKGSNRLNDSKAFIEYSNK